ncbi:hypothetical protein [Amycolatopsis sp. SID8362]|uniref:hypothetical protein n=1 Tax=Amycolatopsis sp. SID8362 TaxID=2690346 RepID=UPI001369EB61|nr:hypothetical protein [Amycolatopsis sp. SID8362]NBH08284.1 hypothetical protein [Amycolatopsis sp. SID8362]NED44979.1 hypothetical protein [Amycolatopsis sp. SID8362]
MNEISSEELPSAWSLGSFESVDEVASLLERKDVLGAGKAWWLTLVSLCTTGLAAAEVGAVDAREWSEALVRALDIAENSGVLDVVDVLHRRMMAHVAAMRYFGTRKGDPVRDPELVLAWFASHFDGSVDVLEEELRRAAASRGCPPREGLEWSMKFLSSVKTALKSVGELVDLLETESQKSLAKKWCKVVVPI